MFQSSILHPINNPDFQIDPFIDSNNGYLPLERPQLGDNEQNDALTINKASLHQSIDAGTIQITPKPCPKVGSKQKRYRTTFRQDQLSEMKSVFELNPNPDTAELHRLSERLGLTKRVLQVWFQNARAKERRRPSYNRETPSEDI